MSTVTAGTKLTTSLTALQWKRGGNTAADIATINNAMRAPTTGSFGKAAATGCGRLENGILYLPDRGVAEPGAFIPLHNNDWIMVDAAGWPVVVPDIIFTTSWQHS
jgi:hypothetical protein